MAKAVGYQAVGVLWKYQSPLTNTGCGKFVDEILAWLRQKLELH